MNTANPYGSAPTHHMLSCLYKTSLVFWREWRRCLRVVVTTSFRWL